MRVVSLVLLAACQGSADDPAGPDPVLPEDPPPSPYIFDEETDPEPTASAQDVEAALQDALDLTMTINADPVQAAYSKAMTGSTAMCPYVYATPDGSYWYDSCTASDGTEFDGYVFAYEAVDVFDPYSGMMVDYWYAFGGATVRDPSDHVLELAGGAVRYKAYTNTGPTDYEVYYTDIGGTFAWDGVESAGTWLDSDIDPDLIVQSTVVPSVGAESVVLYGGFGGFAVGGEDWAVAFDENYVANALMGGRCPTELSGTVGVRAPDGSWYDVQFQGWDGVDPDYSDADCDGCGDAFYRGEPMGEICVDLTTMMELGVHPW
jgi:hypothetical protein